MSLRNIVEIIIQLDSFRNIDLYKRGLYYYQFKIAHEQYGHEILGSPYNCYTQDSLLPKHCNNAPGVIEDTVFKSKTFYIKYCDEDVDIKEIVAFRTEIDMMWTSPPDLIILCQLMYLETEEKNVLRTDNAAPFIEEASCRIVIKNYLYGVNQFLPITFDQNHCSVLNTTIHVVPIDFRFRARLLKDPDPSTQSERLNLFNTLAEFFFPGKSAVTEEDAKLAQDRYVKTLNNAYNKNTKLIKEWTNYAENDNRIAGGQLLPNAMQHAILRVDKINHEDPAVVSQAIMAQIQEAAGNLNLLIYHLISNLLQIPTQVCTFMMLKYNRLIKDRWGESIFRTVMQVDNFSCVGTADTGPKHRNIAKKVRKSEYYQEVEFMHISIDSYFPHPSVHPILFLDISSKIPEEKMLWQDDWIKYMSCSNSYHLIIFVHGFQGNSFDVRGIRNQVALMRSNTILMCSSKNEAHTSTDILSMGKRLAGEVHQFIEDWCKIIKPCKISFVGHSLGGLIIRAALPFLQDISQDFCFFMTLSTPHLGYAYNSSTIVDAGMWIIKKFKKSQAMKQLTMTDSDIAEGSFLYNLSSFEGLEWFKHVALISSFQDEYAPYESARIEVGPEAAQDKKGRIMIEMARNILARITAKKIHRIDVDYKIEKSGIDKMIGRAAHIQMLDNRIVTNMILHCCASFFEL